MTLWENLHRIHAAAGILVFLTLGLSSVSRAQESVRQFEGKTVSKVEVRGLKRIEPEAIRSKVATKDGGRLNLETVADDIRAIHEMGYFDEIEVRADSVAGGVKLTYVVKERPVIAELLFDGNERIDTDDLRDVVKVREWAILDVNQVREDVERIRRHYEEKGFYLAKVSYEVKKVKDDEVQLIYKIRDYDKVRIKKVTFLNNRHFSDQQLKSILMETQEGGLFSFMSGSGSFKESAFKQDLQRLTYWYLDHGFVKFRYESPVVTVSEDKKWLFVSIYVEEGIQYEIGDIDFSGDLLFSKEELHDEIKHETGDTFSITKRNKDIQRLTEKYQDLGYAFVNVIPRMNVDDKTKKVDITYHFEKGNLVYFGEINILGNSKTHDKVIRRELRVHEGQLYSGTNMRISRERVERLGYFAPGEVLFNTITRKGHDDLVDLEIVVKERSTGTITLGAGYGSVQKFFLNTQISEINLFGRGYTLSLQGSWSADSRNRSFNLGFTEPYLLDTRWSVGFDVFSLYTFIPDKYDTRKLGFDVRVGYPLTDEINFFLTYKNEGLQVTKKVDPTADTSLDEGVLSSIVWSMVRDVRNNRFETTEGNYQLVSIETAGLGGDKRFVKWRLNNRFYVPIVGDLVFKNSTEYGQIAQIGERGLPPMERFYLGGPNNMRGFAPYGLGPKIVKTVDGKTILEPIGGAVQFFSLFELEHPLIREAGLKFVTFFDIGNAWSSFPGTSGEPLSLRTDAGLGLRWFSPIGPLRFEWGFPLVVKPGERDMEFQFMIGTPF